MGVTLYHFPPSAPSRGALLAAKLVGVDVDVRILNLRNKEQLKEDFVKFHRVRNKMFKIKINHFCVAKLLELQNNDIFAGTLYHFPPSAPSRGALLAAKLVGVDVDVRILNLRNKEQLKEDFVKLNPQHTVPTLVDGDFILWDSHAIAAYLATSYSKDDSIYPKDAKQRALVDQRMYFNVGTLYPKIRKICYPILWLGEDQIFDEHKTPLEEALGFLDVFLEGNDFACGKKLTIADCCLVASVSSLIAIGWDISPYTNVKNWVSRCALSLPGYEDANLKGAEEFGKAVRSKLAPGQLN